MGLRSRARAHAAFSRLTMKNPKCWARCLDDCSPKITGEHRISNRAWTLEDPALTGKDARRARDRKRIYFGRGELDRDGAPLTADAFYREITVGNMVVKNLCDVHNPALSDADNASGQLSDAIVGYKATMNERRGSLLRFVPRVFDVDGPNLERWFLKTAISNLIDDGRPIGAPTADSDAPADALVRMVFGLEPMALGVGMWGTEERDTMIRMPEEFTMQAIARPAEPQPYICACAFTFRGVRFVAGLDLLNTISDADVNCLDDWERAKLIRPLTFIENTPTAAVIRFKWPGIAGTVYSR